MDLDPLAAEALEVWLIGGDDNFISQFLMVLGVEKKNTKKKKENVQ